MWQECLTKVVPVTDDLARHFLLGFALLLAGLLLTLFTEFKLEGISIQLFGGFASMLAALALVAREDE